METEIEKINERNKRVELDKAWEVSKTRRGIIVVVTYLVAAMFLRIVGNQSPHLNALVPVGGYLFSTLSLPVVKQWWIDKNN